MLSRAANSIYWMSRYLERADNVARFVDVNLHLMLDLDLPGTSGHWRALLHTSNDNQTFSQRYSEINEANVIQFLTFDAENPNSLLSCIHKARENARTVREIIASDMWELANELYHFVNKQRRKTKAGDMVAFYNQMKRFNHLFVGISENSLSHGEGWHFARSGRLIERLDKTARILDVKYFLLLPSTDYVDSPHDTVEWGAVLKSATAFEMYRKRFHRANYHDVADFLLFDSEFPRSIVYCIKKIVDSLEAIAGLHGTHSAALESAKDFKHWLGGHKIADVWKKGLHEFIDELQIRNNAIDQAVFESFFALRVL